MGTTTYSADYAAGGCKPSVLNAYGILFVGVGIGIAFGIEIAIDEHSDIGADSDTDTDSDPEISRYGINFRNWD